MDVSGTFLREMRGKKRWCSQLEQFSGIVVNMISPINFDIIVGNFNDTVPKASPISYGIVNLETGIIQSTSITNSYRCRLFKVNTSPSADQVSAAYKRILSLLKETHSLVSIIYHYSDEYLRLIIQLSINGIDINSMLIREYGFELHRNQQNFALFVPHTVKLTDVLSDDEEGSDDDDYTSMVTKSNKVNWRHR